MLKSTFYFCLAFFVVNQALAQKHVITEEGEVIELNPDGTWINLDDRADRPREQKTPGCDFRVNERDQFAEEQWLIMQSKPLVSHTRSAVEDRVKWEEFAQANINCAYISGNYAAFITWKIQTRAPEEVLGGLSRGNEFKIFLKDSQDVEVEFLDNSLSKEYDEKNYTKFSNHVAFSDEQVKAIIDHPVEKIGVEWDQEYVEYPVENANILIDQFRCVISNVK
ncbi:MAG: hypothetical protein ACNS62_11680 [Candidatus Cyclobacteriaceae bacterium M3_2C_046]